MPACIHIDVLYMCVHVCVIFIILYDIVCQLSLSTHLLYPTFLTFPHLNFPPHYSPFPFVSTLSNSGTDIDLSNCFLIRFKVQSAEANACFVSLIWPRTHGWSLISPSDESTTIILLNRHSIKLFNTTLNRAIQYYRCPDV